MSQSPLCHNGIGLNIGLRNVDASSRTLNTLFSPKRTSCWFFKTYDNRYDANCHPASFSTVHVLKCSDNKVNISLVIHAVLPLLRHRGFAYEIVGG